MGVDSIPQPFAAHLEKMQNIELFLFLCRRYHLFMKKVVHHNGRVLKGALDGIVIEDIQKPFFFGKLPHFFVEHGPAAEREFL